MRNIIIAGGGLINKGAQAMTLISICELKKRFPAHRILLLAWNTGPEEQKRHAIYDLELCGIPPLKFAQAAKNPLKRLLFSLRYGKTFTDVDAIYRNTDLFIDISGYAIGSNWEVKVCHDYLDNIEHALAYDIPVYLMPQSFGPFNYTEAAGKEIDARTRRLFPQIRHIFAREQEGYEALIDHYGLTNVTLTHDMVLASKLDDYSEALREKPVFDLPTIPENSMCLIPNVRVSDSRVNDIEKLYCSAVKAGLAQGLYVYITYHSAQDKTLCTNLKSAFADNERVIFLEHDHSCIEFNELVKKFRFVVASRFHAIVHALKNGVPCVALGWAVKYVELMKLFGQERYIFDLRWNVDDTDVAKAVEDLAHNWRSETKTIRNALSQLQQVNVFDYI